MNFLGKASGIFVHWGFVQYIRQGQQKAPAKGTGANEVHQGSFD